MLSDLGADLREFGDLDPEWLALCDKAFSGSRERKAAMLTFIWRNRDDFINEFNGNQGTMFSGMPLLASGLASAFFPFRIDALSGRRAIRGRWLGGVRRIFLSSLQLMFQIGDFLVALRNFFLEGVRFSLKGIGFPPKVDQLLFVLRDLFLEFLVLFPETADFSPHFFENSGEALRNSPWDVGF